MRGIAAMLGMLLALGVATPAAAASLKATLIMPADDARLERTRLEHAYLGHPGGPASDGLESRSTRASSSSTRRRPASR